MEDAIEAGNYFKAEFEAGMHRCLLEPDKKSAQQESGFYTTSNGPMEPHMEDWTTEHVKGKRGFATPENMRIWYRQHNKQRKTVGAEGKMLDADIERIKGVASGTPLALRIRAQDGVFSITVDAAQPVEPSLRSALGLTKAVDVKILLGGQSIALGTFEENQVYENSMIDVIQSSSAFDVVVNDLLSLHPLSDTVTLESLTDLAEFDEDGTLQSWVLAGLGLKALPESIGTLKVAQDLWLCDNQLESLPASFKDMNVGGKIWLMRQAPAFIDNTGLRSTIGTNGMGIQIYDPHKSESHY